MKHLLRIIPVLAFALLAVACSDDSSTPTPPSSNNPTFTSTSVKVGAVYFSFDSGTEAPQMDVRFGKYPSTAGAPGNTPQFRINEALLGDTHVKIYSSGQTSLADVATVDTAQFATDPEYKVSGDMWYDYNPSTHTLVSKGLVYVVMTAAGTVAKFRIDSYDQAQSTFVVSSALLLSSGAWSATQTVSLTIATDEKLLNFATGVLTAKPWDIKLCVISVPSPIGPVSFPGIVLNRDKGVLAKIVDGTAFADVDAAAVTGLMPDTDTSYAIGTECLSYDQNTHHLSPYGNRTFVVQTVAAKRAKFQMLSYYNDSGVSGYMKFEYVVK
jgi:hypothetical protein